MRRRALIVLSSLERAVYVALRRAHGDTPTEISRAQIAELVDGAPSARAVRIALKALEAVGLVSISDSRRVIAALDVPSSVDVTGLSRDSRISDLTFDDPSV
jgi:hypothetical protein